MKMPSVASLADTFASWTTHADTVYLLSGSLFTLRAQGQLDLKQNTGNRPHRKEWLLFLSWEFQSLATTCNSNLGQASTHSGRAEDKG